MPAGSRSPRRSKSRRRLSASPPSAERGVHAPLAAAVRRDAQEDEAEQHGRLAVVLDRPESFGLMELEIGDRHLAREDERDRPGQEAEQNRQASVELEHATDPGLGQERRMAAVLSGDSAEPVEDLVAAGLHEQQTGDDAQQ